MLPERVLQLTIPLSPYLRPGEKKPHESQRIRPADALDLQRVVREMKRNALTTVNVCGKPWSIVSVYSPYSPDVHVMALETSVERYLPGPEAVPDDEGDHLMALWATILDFVGKRRENATVHAGYNWSPRAWGEEEEKDGFQSVPTKWHPMLWGWPAFPAEGSSTEYARWVDTVSLSLQQRRLLGDNNYAEPLGWLIKKRLRDVFAKNTLFCELFPHCNWIVDERGLHTSFELSMVTVLRAPRFFSELLRPLAQELERIAKELTEAMTDLLCEDSDRLVTEVVSNPTEEVLLRNLERLRAAPAMKAEGRIKEIFGERRYPESLLEAIWDPVWYRCNETGDRTNWWRKGFGYALSFRGPSQGERGELRIMPGLFVGPGGMVEAEGVLLRRPEDRHVSDDEARRKSEVLWELADIAKAQFGEY